MMQQLEIQESPGNPLKLALLYLFSFALAGYTLSSFCQLDEVATSAEKGALLVWPGLLVLVHLVLLGSSRGLKAYLTLRLSGFARSRFLRREGETLYYGFRFFGREFTELSANLEGVRQLECKHHYQSKENGWQVVMQLSPNSITKSLERFDEGGTNYWLALGPCVTCQEAKVLLSQLSRMTGHQPAELDETVSPTSLLGQSHEH